MSGNVWEWVEDDWHSNYNGAPTDGRAWVDSPRASYRVLPRRQLGLRPAALPRRLPRQQRADVPLRTTSAFAWPSSLEAAIRLVSSSQVRGE
jgi:formylglycine-generating enzyme required for sulfatase activity